MPKVVQYLNKPGKKTKKPIKKIDYDFSSRIVITEKSNKQLERILSSLDNSQYTTEIIPLNNNDIAIYQTCEKLSKQIFGKASKKIDVVRLMIFDTHTFKNIVLQYSLERYFEMQRDCQFTTSSSWKDFIMTGLIAIPTQAKHSLIKYAVQNRLDRLKKEIEFNFPYFLITRALILPSAIKIENIYKDFKRQDSRFIKKEINNFCDKVKAFEIATPQ